MNRVEGLSPRVWGNRTLSENTWIFVWSIPTCVGQPLLSCFCLYLSKVYPHVCGATIKNAYRVGISGGLSPRVWGNPSMAGKGPMENRSIPTCVGQPDTWIAPVATTEVYPHVCGATLRELPVIELLDGLSPRVWGNRTDLTRKRITARSIPTCVGQPVDISSTVVLPKVYPHVCGATPT